MCKSKTKQIQQNKEKKTHYFGKINSWKLTTTTKKKLPWLGKPKLI